MSAATPQGTSDDPTAAPPPGDPGPHDRLGNRELAAADLADWRKLAQALHARFTIPDYRAGAAFVGAVAEAAADAGHHP